MATTAVVFDDFPLIGVTPAGGRSKVLDMEGWLSATNTRSRGRNTGGHGSWSSRGWRAEKPIVIPGQVVYPSAAVAADERRTMLNLGGFGEALLVVTDSLGTIGQLVEVDDVDVPPVTDRLLRFTFELTATDPFARSMTPVTVAVAAGATVPFTGAGKSVAEIEVTTTSAGTVVLSAGGLTLRTSALPSGAVLTSGRGFTNPKRTVRGPGGEDLFSATLAPMQWPAVVPGANSFVNTGSADVDVTYYPTY